MRVLSFQVYLYHTRDMSHQKRIKHTKKKLKQYRGVPKRIIKTIAKKYSVQSKPNQMPPIFNFINNKIYNKEILVGKI